MCEYAINNEAGKGSIYVCGFCSRVFFSPLLKPVGYCLTCLLDNRFRAALLKSYGPTHRELLDQNTIRTQADVADVMGISRQRVQQIEISALAKVRAHMIKNEEQEIKVDMNCAAIAGRLVRDIRMMTSKNGNKFIAGTILTEDEGPDERIFSTYWDFVGFGERNVAKAEKLVADAPVYATGRVRADTYEGKDGTTKATLKVFGDIGLLNSVPPDSKEDSPF